MAQKLVGNKAQSRQRCVVRGGRDGSYRLRVEVLPLANELGDHLLAVFPERSGVPLRGRQFMTGRRVVASARLQVVNVNSCWGRNAARKHRRKSSEMTPENAMGVTQPSHKRLAPEGFLKEAAV